MTTQDEIEKHIDEILLGGGGHTWQRRQIMKLLAAHDKEIVRQAEVRARIDEASRFNTRRHYGMDYQENLDELDDYKDARIAELEQQLDLNEEENDE